MTADVIPRRLANAAAELRVADEADAVAGVRPSFVASPASTEEASAVLAAAAELGLAVVPRGAGTRLDWGLPPSRCDLVVDTRRLDQVLEHAAGDLVVRVQAGVRLARLAEVLGAAGQRLALDPPGRAYQAGADQADGDQGGTVGGLIATGVAGPLRLRYGAPRDLLIGITMVRSDGTVARAGGKVVKNVAGYDLGKLLAGSYGTLGLITEATFRLHPRPPAAAWVSLASGDPDAAAAALLAAGGSALAPSAAELDWPGGDAPLAVSVLLEGDPEGVAERADRLTGLLDGAAVSDEPPPWWGRGPAAAGDGTVLRIAFWAGRLAAVLAAVRAAAATTGADPAVGGSAAAGVLHAALPAATPADVVASFVTELRAGLRAGPASATADSIPAGILPAGAGTSVVVLHAPPAVTRAVDVWGPVPALTLMQAVKDQFDPEHRLAPGRFAGGAS
jgi:glycolate oxidase FAD binding subunit